MTKNSTISRWILLGLWLVFSLQQYQTSSAYSFLARKQYGPKMQTPCIMGEFWDVYCHNISCSILYLLLTRNALGNMSNDPSTKTHIAYVCVSIMSMFIYFRWNCSCKINLSPDIVGKKEERWVVMISKCSFLLSSFFFTSSSIHFQSWKRWEN